MRARVALVIVLNGLAFAQNRPVAHFEQLDEIRSTKCTGTIPDGFSCGILFDLDLPDSNNMIGSVVGGTIEHLSVILDGALYTLRYDPPLQRDDKFSKIGKKTRVPARVDDDDLIIRWPDGTEAKGKITRRERINPDRPQPARYLLVNPPVREVVRQLIRTIADMPLALTDL